MNGTLCVAPSLDGRNYSKKIFVVNPGDLWSVLEVITEYKTIFFFFSILLNDTFFVKIGQVY